MGKIGDIFSDGFKIGEIWEGDDLSGCIGAILGPIILIAILVWATKWFWEHEPEVIWGLILSLIGCVIAIVAWAQKDNEEGNEGKVIVTAFGTGMAILGCILFLVGVIGTYNRINSGGSSSKPTPITVRQTTQLGRTLPNQPAPPAVPATPSAPTPAQLNSGSVSGVQPPLSAGQIEIPTQEPVNQNVPPTVVVVPIAVPTPVPPARLVVDVTKADGTPFGVCIFIYHQITDAAGKPTFGDWAGSSGFVCNQSHSSFDVTPGVYAVKFTSGGGSSPSWGYYPEERTFGYEVVEGQTTNVRVTLGRLRVAFLAVDGSALTGAKVWAGSQKSDVNGKPVYGNAMVEGYTGNTGYAEFDLTEGTYALEVWKGCCEVALKGLQFNKVVVSGEVTEERIRISE